MTRRLLISYVTITVIVLVVLEIPLGVVFARSEHRKLVSELKNDALALAVLSDETLERSAHGDLMALAHHYEKQTGGRVIITDAKGVLVADSSATTLVRTSYANRPEIAAALKGREVSGTQASLGKTLLYVATPVASGGDVYGAVRITYAPTVVDRTVRRGWLVLALFGAVALASVFGISVVLARSVTRPLRDLEAASTDLAEGDLSTRAEMGTGPHEIRALAAAFNAMAERLEHLMRSQEEFVADASHQLRSPLHALRLRLENAEAASDRPAADEIRGALQEVERLGRLVDGLLQLARADVDKPAAESIDLAKVIAGRTAAWEALAAERRVSFETKPAAPTAIVTASHVEQALDNLIANAIAVTPEGSPISVTAARADGWVEVHVVDGGPGMSAEERARATDRFWRSAASGRKGSGLGLAIARRLIEVDGGEIELRAADSGGVDAVIKLRPDRGVART